MVVPLSRLVLSVTLAASLSVAGAAAAHATDYLVPVGTSTATQFAATNQMWTASKFVVPSGAGATVTYALAVVTNDPFAAPTSLIIYGPPTVDSGNPNLATMAAPLATFTQTGAESGLTGFTPLSGDVYRVSYAGSATLAPGTYYASVQSSSARQNVWGGTGSATSAWEWGPRTTVGSIANAYPYYWTLDSGALWRASGNVAVTMITLADSGTALSSGPSSSPPSSSSSPAEPDAESGPPTVLQQVRAPESDSCRDVADTDLHLGTGITGGWSRSWAEWANGPVCTRTLTYVNEVWHLQ